MMDEMKRIDEAAVKVLAVCGKADIGVILGSGLGDYAEALEDAVKLPYSEIPGFPRSTVAGHGHPLSSKRSDHTHSPVILPPPHC